jgi:hypothetical protein
MSRFGRIRRRPDHWATPHERARVRAAERLDGPLGLAEATWLDEHLSACPDCAAVAAAYANDQVALRALRDAAPQPPRDMWARTAAAIERESVARGRSQAPERASRRRVPLGVLSGVAVIAVVIGASALSSGWLAFPNSAPGDVASGGATDAPTGPEASTLAAAPPTPFAVGAGNVAWVRAGPDGTYYRDAAIERVCPVGGTADCANVDAKQERLDLGLAAAPRTIIGSPTDGQAVVVGDGDGGDQLLVMALPDGNDTAGSGPEESGEPTDTSEPTTTPPPSTATPTTGPSGEPVESVEPTTSPEATPTSSVEPSPTVVPTPESTLAAYVAIAQGVTVVGESAAFSPDGRWFAFTARPADGTGGPDIWVWRVGDQNATQLTTDGAHVFGSWAGSKVVGSTAGSDGADGDAAPTSVLIDPASGATEAIDEAVWRPVVDRDQSRAVAWTGTVRRTDDGSGWAPSDGRLQLGPWDATGDDAGAPTDTQVLADGPLADFDVRWDETGEWFGVWVADTDDAEVGRLSLFHVDPTTGELSQPDGAPSGAAALAGFSIGEGRLAWATPPGQGGEGSRIQIVAWREGSVGTVESVPGEDLVVVR